MKKKLIFSMALLAIIIAACGGQATPASLSPEPAVPTQTVTQSTPASTSANTATVSFSKDVMPILENSCTKCHGVEQTKAGLDVRTYEGLMAGSFKGPVLVVGKSADSLLVQMVTKGKMPKRGDKLTSAQIQTISDWINAGALNN